MNVDRILGDMNRHGVEYLLIGGMNFLLRHEPLLTYDVDLWIDDTEANRGRCETALGDLDCQWGTSEKDWAPVRRRPRGWLASQDVFCMTSPHGAIDVFRRLTGLDNWQAARSEAVQERTADGTAYWGLSDRDMLRCQEALPEGEQKLERVRILRQKLRMGT